MDSGRALKPGAMIAGEWRIERMLGEGGFGVTYEARNTRTGAHVALKEYMPAESCTRAAGSSEVTAGGGVAGEAFAWGRDRFMKEAETLKRLDHPSIVRVADYFEANKTAYMALSFESGGSMKGWLDAMRERGGRPSQEALDRIVWPLCEALTQVHALYMQHRDIKPDNIMLRADGTPVLIDFGAAKSTFAGYSLSRAKPNAAVKSQFTPVSHGYSPPEQYDETQTLLVPATDIYALAATLHYAVTGTEPPRATSRYITDPYQRLTDVAAGQGWRPEFLAGIDRALSMHPKDRPQSAVEFRRALGLLVVPPQAPAVGLSDQSTEVQPATTAAQITPAVTFTEIQSGAKQNEARPSSRLGLGIAAIFVLLALGVGGWWKFVHEPAEAARATAVAAALSRAEAAKKEADQLKAAEQQRLAAAKKAEDDRKAEADRIARERAEQERQAALRQAEQDRIAAAKRAEDERVAREKLQREQIAREQIKSTARHPEILATLIPGSGQSARDTLADGSDCSFCPDMVVVPAGQFLMGAGPAAIAPLAKQYHRSAEFYQPETPQPTDTPQHKVIIPTPFAVGRAHITRGQYAAFVTATAHRSDGGCEFRQTANRWQLRRHLIAPEGSWKTPGFDQADDHPVVCVNWHDTRAFINWLREKTGKNYRLLSESEAEYSERGVISITAPHPQYFFAETGNEICAYANIFLDIAGPRGSNSRNACNHGFVYTSPGGRFRPNKFGLVDMQGNVLSWTENCWHPNYVGAPSDGRARITECSESNSRVARGSAWDFLIDNNSWYLVGAANRKRILATSRSNAVGFRVARDLN